MITKRLERITRIPKEYFTTILPPPKAAKIELVSSCNFRCKFCALMSRNGDKVQDMDFDLFKRITTEMAHIGIEEIGPFLIGEPFMKPRLLADAVNYLKSELYVPYTFVTSNAGNAIQKYVNYLMYCGLDSLKWSINAADEKQFSEMMGVDERRFFEILDNVRSAWKVRNHCNYKTKLYASSIHYDDNQRKIMEPLLTERILPYVDEHYWLPLYSMGGQRTENETGFKPIAGNQGRADDPVDPIPCWSLFTSAHVLSDGRMTACCADSTGKWAVGDLKTHSFMECWNSEEFQELRQAHLLGNIAGTKCEKCALIS